MTSPTTDDAPVLHRPGLARDARLAAQRRENLAREGTLMPLVAKARADSVAQESSPAPRARGLTMPAGVSTAVMSPRAIAGSSVQQGRSSCWAHRRSRSASGMPDKLEPMLAPTAPTTPRASADCTPTVRCPGVGLDMRLVAQGGDDLALVARTGASTRRPASAPPSTAAAAAAAAATAAVVEDKAAPGAPQRVWGGLRWAPLASAVVAAFMVATANFASAGMGVPLPLKICGAAPGAKNGAGPGPPARHSLRGYLQVSNKTDSTPSSTEEKKQEDEPAEMATPPTQGPGDPSGSSGGEGGNHRSKPRGGLAQIKAVLRPLASLEEGLDAV